MTSRTKLDLRSVTDETFGAEVLSNDRPVLVDFWADRCAPCKMLAPVLAEIAAERADELTIVKIDTVRNPVTTRTYQVMAMPTLLLFVDGRPVHAMVGARVKFRLLTDLDAALERQ